MVDTSADNQEPSPPRRLRNRPRRGASLRNRLVLAAGASLLTLMAAEWIVRGCRIAPAVRPLWTSTSNSVYQRSSNPLLSFELKSNYRNDRPDLRRSYERTNAHGQRDRERTLQKSPGVRRVILLGDSVVEGFGIAETETISSQLEQILQNEAVEVLNFGVSAYCTLAEVELLRTKGVDFGPDDVVLVFTVNDYDNYNQESWPLTNPLKRPTWTKHLFVNSDLFRLVAIDFNLFDFGLESDPLRWNRVAIGENNVVEGLQRFRALANQYQFRPLVAIWPHFLDAQIMDGQVMGDDRQTLIIERLCRMYGLPTYRISTAFRQESQKNGPVRSHRLRYTIGDSLHPSAEGCRIAATALKGVLREMVHGRYKMSNSGPEDLPAVAAAAVTGRESHTYGNLWINLGNESLLDEDYEDAARYFRMAIEVLGDEPAPLASAHHALGALLGKQRAFSESERHLRLALELAPGNPHVRLTLGTVYLASKQYMLAVPCLQNVVRSLPQDSKAHFHLGAAFAGTGNQVDAKTQYTLAAQLQPTLAPAHQALAWLLATSGAVTPEDASQAIRSAEKAARLTGHQSAVCLDTLAAAYAAAGQFEDAVHWQGMALKMATTEERGDYSARLQLYCTQQPYCRRASDLPPRK